MFGAYYVILVVGETLVDRLVISPVVGMWGANLLLLVLAVVAASGGVGGRDRRVPSLS